MHTFVRESLENAKTLGLKEFNGRFTERVFVNAFNGDFKRFLNLCAGKMKVGSEIVFKTSNRDMPYQDVEKLLSKFGFIIAVHCLSEDYAESYYRAVKHRHIQGRF